METSKEEMLELEEIIGRLCLKQDQILEKITKIVQNSEPEKG